MDIYSLTIPSGDDIFYTKSFMDTLESHVGYFRTSRKTTTIQVDPKKAIIYNGDFFGYLNEFKIDQKYHWIIMRVNDLYSTFEFNIDKTELVIPDRDEIEQIRCAYVATGAISL